MKTLGPLPLLICAGDCRFGWSLGPATAQSKRSMAWYDKIKKVGKYDSRFEADVAMQLKEASVKSWHEPLRALYENSTWPHFYLPDFGAKTKDGRRVLIEVKGWIDKKAAQKMAAVKYQNPDLDIRFVFQRGDTKVAKLKSTNLQWAKRLKFPAAVGTIPEEWIAEFLKVDEWKARKVSAQNSESPSSM